MRHIDLPFDKFLARVKAACERHEWLRGWFDADCSWTEIAEEVYAEGGTVGGAVKAIVRYEEFALDLSEGGTGERP